MTRKIVRDTLTRMGAGALATLSSIQLRLNILIMLCNSFCKITFLGFSWWRSILGAGLFSRHICSYRRNKELSSARKADNLMDEPPTIFNTEFTLKRGKTAMIGLGQWNTDLFIGQCLLKIWFNMIAALNDVFSLPDCKIISIALV